jgi:hypothetical protein
MSHLLDASTLHASARQSPLASSHNTRYELESAGARLGESSFFLARNIAHAIPTISAVGGKASNTLSQGQQTSSWRDQGRCQSLAEPLPQSRPQRGRPLASSPAASATSKSVATSTPSSSTSSRSAVFCHRPQITSRCCAVKVWMHCGAAAAAAKGACCSAVHRLHAVPCIKPPSDVRTTL